MWKKAKPYLFFIFLSLGVGGLSALLTRNSMDIYKTVNKPALAPPSVLFPIVWSLLFILMGIGAARVWKKRQKKPEACRDALMAYIVNLIANVTWSILFFNSRAFLFAFIWLIVLLAIIVFMIVCFARVDKTAAYLQIPYLLWVCFAGYLNLAIWLLNR